MISTFKNDEPSPRGSVCILIAEDDSEMRDFLGSSLKRAGYDVLEVANGHELGEFLADISSSIEKKLDPGVDAIITDIRMPGKTALDVLIDFKRIVCKVPVILITAFGDQQTIDEAMNLGATAVFDKPFDIHDFKTFLMDLVPPPATFDS